MSSSRIEFSAQFGGKDAAATALPYFKALKAASRGLRLDGFSYPTLAFILRVDGQVNRYDLSGAGNIDIDADGEYLSVDLGITYEDRAELADALSKALLSSIELIKAVVEEKNLCVDFHSLQTCLLKLICRFKNGLISA